MKHKIHCIKLIQNKYKFIFLLFFHVGFSLTLFSETPMKKVFITKKIKLDYPISLYTNYFPSTFFVTKDEKILINYQERDAQNYMLLLNHNGTLYKRINLRQYLVSALDDCDNCDYYDDLFLIGSVSDQCMFDSTTMYISGQKKLFVVDLLKEKIVHKDYGGLIIKSDKEEDIIFMNVQLKGRIMWNTIRKFNIKTNKLDTIINILDSDNFYYVDNGFLYYIVRLSDSLKMVSYNKTEQTRYEKLKYNNNETDTRLLGVNNNKIIINLILYREQDDNTLKFDSCSHYIHIYDRKTVKLNEIIHIDFNETIHDNFGKYDYIVMYPRGLIYHYSRYFNRLYVMFFIEDGAYIDYIDLNDD